MKRCQPRQRRRLAATSGRSCSAALSDFFTPQPEAAQRVVQGREAGDDADTMLQLPLELDQRDARLRLDQPAQGALVRLKQWAAMPAVARRCGAAGRAHPLHQLDRGRGADREAACRLAD
jgi:hypothetical protein